MKRYFEVKVKVFYEEEAKNGSIKFKTKHEKVLIRAKKIDNIAVGAKKHLKTLFDDFEIVNIRDYDIIDVIDLDSGSIVPDNDEDDKDTNGGI